MSDEPEVPKPSEWGSIIPHFHYDVMGGIVPGAYLLAGAYWLTVSHSVSQGSVTQIRGDSASKLSVSLSPIEFLLLTIAAYAVGFIMGPVSHLFFNWLCRLKDQDVPSYAQAFTGKLYERITVKAKSDLCLYTLWVQAPQLAMMCSRWDAEAFAACQFGMATIILTPFLWYMIYIGHLPYSALYLRCLAVLPVLIVVLCGFQFYYSRRRGILARFIMLTRTSSEKARGASA